MLTWRQFAELPIFPEFYRLIRGLFGIDIAILSPDGCEGLVPGQGRELNRFCREINRTTEGRSRCQACNTEHAAQAARQLQPVSYVCHAGLTELIVPIIIGERVIAHLQCGQMLGGDPHERAWARTRAKVAPFLRDAAGLRAAFMTSPVIPLKRRRQLASLLQLFSYHVALAHERLLLLEQEPQDRVLGAALEYLKAHFLETVSLDDVAAAAGTSKRTLVRLFRLKQGRTVLQHLHRLRLEYACSRLRMSHDKIIAVALASGFNSIQSFNRAFRIELGCTPGQWRKSTRHF